MKYLRIRNNIIEYPFNLELLKTENPKTGFPSDLSKLKLTDYNIHIVDEIDKPSDENFTKLITEGIPEFINGKYQQKWIVTNAPIEYTKVNRNTNAKIKLNNDRRIALVALMEQELINKAQTIIVDAEAVKYKSLYPLWEDLPIGSEIIKDLKVNFIDTAYNIKLFKCIQKHNKQSNWTPSSTPALWSEITIGANGIEIWVQPIGGDGKYTYINPATNLPYKVTHKNSTWENSHQDGLNVWEPGVFGWTKL